MILILFHLKLDPFSRGFSGEPDVKRYQDGRSKSRLPRIISNVDDAKSGS
jgi:hypothetical protein